MLLAQHQEPKDKQIQEAIYRLRQANAGKTSGAATSLQQPVPLMTTEAPEDVHHRKRIKLQPGWLYHASPDGVDENLLILLHGYGDTPEPYAKLARQMALPQTACLALPGPIGRVPGTPNGRAWYSEEDEDKSPTGGNSSSNSVTSTFQWLQQVLAGLQGSNGWQASHTHLFGFSQGGSAALHLALHCRGEAKLGSCVAVAAALLPQQLKGLIELQQQQQAAGSATPVLITHGSKDTEVPQSRAQATAAAAARTGSITQFHSIPGKGHGMISGPAEMRLLMAFWGQSLKHRPTQVSTGDPSHTSFVEVHGGVDTLSSLQQQP
ncbi:TPA: hypothetical protein ACH3X3_011319 [Trebouxia sp. C0006]